MSSQPPPQGPRTRTTPNQGRSLGYIVAWLTATRLWSTPLHHLTIIDGQRARALLRAGADLHAAAEAGGPTPLSLATARRAEGQAPASSPAALVLQAAGPWSPATHPLFPAAARARAVELLLLGQRLSREPRFGTEGGALSDAWMGWVLPHAVQRAGLS